jgi:hypothetical protein
MRWLVGQARSLRRPRRPPDAGVRIVLGTCHQAGLYRIQLDIPLNPPKFVAIAHQMIVTLVLPKGLTRPAQKQIGPPCVVLFREQSNFDAWMFGVINKCTWLLIITDACS